MELVIEALSGQYEEVLSAHVFESFGEMDVSNQFREVCSRDYGWMRRCDVFVAVLPLNSDGTVVFSGGTSVELGWASATGKPIVLVCDPQPKYSHLVIGLDAVARVVKVDINRSDLAAAVCNAVELMLASAEMLVPPEETDAISMCTPGRARSSAGLAR